MPFNQLILCHPLLLLPSVFPSIRVFSSESVLRIRWLKYWNFSFSISPSNEYSGLISFRIDWFDLIAVQGTPKGLLQHHNSKTSSFWCSSFFRDLPGGTSCKEPTCQCRIHKRHGFDPWVRKIPWRRKRQPIPVFLPGESHEQRNGGLQSWGSQRVSHN